MMRIIDNLSTLLGDVLKEEIAPGARVKIAASCFSIYAFEALKEELTQLESLQFIFTSPTFVPTEATDKIKKERREFFIPKKIRESSLAGTEFEIQLRNKLTQRAIARECASWIREKVTFRSNATNAPMQQFMHVSGPGPRGEDASAYMLPNGFTAVDLGYQKGNALSNLVTCFSEPDHTRLWLNIFNQMWSDPDKLTDVTEAVCAHIETIYQENSPERIYFQILHHLFEQFLLEVDQDVLPNDRTGFRDTQIWQKLYHFQADAAVAIINKLETFNGCILADSVGLGKTFTALAVIKYYELRNRSVLVLCPKKLGDNWKNFNANLVTNTLAKDRLNYDVLYHTDLSRESGESNGMPLNRINWGNYDLVVIDESHNFRNNDVFKDRETRYQRLMNRVIRAGVKTKVLMLSATPVNNRFNDLKNQLALAYEGDPELLQQSLGTQSSIDTIFREAQAAFNKWSLLVPEERTPDALLERLDFEFFELLDAVTIARSRKHIETFYNADEVGSFPERRRPLSFRCPITERADVLDLDAVVDALQTLNLAVYAPMSYVFPSRVAKYEALYDTSVHGGSGKFRHVDRERALRQLMTINLLKRLESSVEAFRLTLNALAANLRDKLQLIDAFESAGASAGAGQSARLNDALMDANTYDLGLEDDELAELQEASEFSVGKRISIDLGDVDLKSWRAKLDSDLQVIQRLSDSMERVAPEDDSKLQHLIGHISQKIDQPINPGNRKILIFTAFADTARYLFDQLAPMASQRGLTVAEVTGTGAPRTTLPKRYDFQTVLTLFSPISKEKALVLPRERAEIDVLIATDCISEGQNLQDCDYVINYDIHWNPVRIIQRFGRIDRIGSPNTQIQLVNYWPDITLDEYIRLKERVENRMVITDLTASGDDNLLTEQSGDISYRREQLQRLQDGEVLDLEDTRAGISITDLGLNDFRMDLLDYTKKLGDIGKAPLGLHAVVPADPARDLLPGVFFVLRNIHPGVNINQQNRLHPFYVVYIDEAGEVLVDHTRPKRLLDLIRTACKGNNTPLLEVCRQFNHRTDDGRQMQRYSELLSAAIRSMVEVKQQKDIDSLFSGRQTTALTHTIRGLQDFELIAFLVVEGSTHSPTTDRPY